MFIPNSIGWNYNPDLITFPLEKYEKGRPNRRSMREMALPRKVREEILKKEWGIPQTELAAAVRSTIKVKNQRRATVNNLGKADKAEEMMESAGRKMKLFAKNTDKKTEQLMAAAKNANANAAVRKSLGETDSEETPEETPEPVVSKMSKITISEDDGEVCAA
jgi:phage shock protein A